MWLVVLWVSLCGAVLCSYQAGRLRGRSLAEAEAREAARRAGRLAGLAGR